MAQFAKIMEKAEVLQALVGKCYHPIEENLRSAHFQSEEQKRRFRSHVERLRKADTGLRAIYLAADSLRNVNPKDLSGKKFADVVEENSHSDLVYGAHENNAVRLLESIDRDLNKDDESIVDDDGSGMIVGVMTYSRKDPISKSNIVDPVQNKFCKHVYDRSSVEAFIKQLTQMRQLRQCPVASCPNKRNLDMKDLMNFPDFFKFVRDED